MNPVISVSAYTVSTALGTGVEANCRALAESRSGLVKADILGIALDTWLGVVPGVDTVELPAALAGFRCRNNHLAELALQQDDMMGSIDRLIHRYGADRIGLFIGTSTSGIQQTEMAYAQGDAEGLPGWFDYTASHDLFSPCAYLLQRLGLRGPAQTISTACSSSARVFGAAVRHIQAGFCDAAVVGGVDSLCQMTVYGFNSLQLTSTDLCRPADIARSGINIGEAAGFALLEKDQPDASLCLLGYGESSDGWHMSSPHPQGVGAAQAMQQALSSAGLSAAQVDYINLHGTATPANDLAEDQAMMSVFADGNRCSSTKGFTGHTLGAAGIVSAVFSCIEIEHQFLPVSLNTREVDARIQANLVLQQPTAVEVNIVMSNCYGFGGSNASLIIGQQP